MVQRPLDSDFWIRGNSKGIDTWYISLKSQQFVKLKLGRKKFRLNVVSSQQHYYIWKQLLLELQWEGECKISISYVSSELHTTPASVHCHCTQFITKHCHVPHVIHQFKHNANIQQDWFNADSGGKTPIGQVTKRAFT